MKISLDLLAMKALPSNRKMIALRALIEAMIVVDWNYLLENPGIPKLADFAKDGAIKIDKAPSDTWRDIPAIIAAGCGGAKDFVCWRIAELRSDGEDDVYPHIKVFSPEPGMHVYQVSVRHGLMLEDPSAGIVAVER